MFDKLLIIGLVATILRIAIVVRIQLSLVDYHLSIF